MVNAGIYGILAEQTALAVAAGVLSFTAPSVVGAAVPVFVTYIFGAICFVGVAVQPIGFFGVFREKTTTFRVYAALNAIVTFLGLVVGAVIVIISAVRHNTAMSNCKAAYFSPASATSSAALETLKQEADILCLAFAWADIGFMAGLWVIVFITQTYFIWTSRNYGKVQVSDHKLYHSVYSENPEAFTMSILQSRRYNPDSVMFTNSMYGGNPPPLPDDQAWNHRSSHDEPGPESGGGYYNHQRGYSDGRAAQYDEYTQHQQQHGGGYVDSSHPPQHNPNDGQQHVHYPSSNLNPHAHGG